jgi:hypothetical protein
MNKTIDSMTSLKQFLDDNEFNLKTTLHDKTQNTGEAIVVVVADLPTFIDCGNNRSYTTEINIQIYAKRENMHKYLSYFTKKFKNEFSYNFISNFEQDTEMYQLNFLTSFFVSEFGQLK